MSRYIDADTIEPLLKEERDFHKKMYDNMQQPCEHDDKQIVGAYYTAYSKSYHAVKDAPTVDAVPVTRCAQCKWWWKVNELCTHPKHCHDNVCVHECGKDYYCADGEREKQ